MSDQKYFVAVTNLHIRNPLSWFRFIFVAIACIFGAGRTRGFISGKVGRYGMTYCTLSIWETNQAKQIFQQSWIHAFASWDMKYYCDEVVTGYWTQDDQTLPSWKTAHEFLLEKGKTVPLKFPNEKQKNRQWEYPPEFINSKIINLLLFKEIPILKLYV